MSTIHEQLQSVVKLYFDTKKKVLTIENESAISPLHQSFVNNIRHALDHIMVGLQRELENRNDSAEHYAEAHAHLSNLGPDAYQYIAGRMLRKATSAIEEVGFFGEAGNAKSLLSQAVDHYSRGRELRTPDPEQSMEQFSNCVSLAKDAKLNIALPSRREVARFWLGVLGGGGFVGIVAVILKLLGYL